MPEGAFRHVVDGLTDAIVRFDRDLRYAYVNVAGTHASALPRAEWLGRTPREVGLPEAEARLIEKGVREVFDTGREVAFDYDAQTPLGQRYYHCRVVPERAPDMAVQTVLVVTSDVTALKRAEHALHESESRLRSLFEGVPVGLFRISPEGRLLDANEALVRMLDYPGRTALLAVPISQICPDPSTRAACERALVERGVVRNFELPARRADGSPLMIRTSARAHADATGHLLWYDGVVEDVTQRRQAELALRRRLQLEQTLTTISARFAGTMDLDRAIGTSLADLGEATNAGRAYLFRLRENGERLERTHEWCAPGVAPDVEDSPSLRPEALPWLLAKLRRREPVHLPDVSALPQEASAEREALQARGARAVVMFPVDVSGELVGFMGFDDVTRTGGFNTEDVALIEVVSHVVGHAIERERAQHRLATRERQQAAVAELGLLALRDGDLGNVMRVAVERLAQVLDVEYAKVLELLPDGEALRLVAGVGWRPGLVGSAILSARGESQAGFTLQAQGPITVWDLSKELRFTGPTLLHEHGVVSGVSVIIHGRDRAWGVLGAHTRRKRAFTHDDVNFMQAVANVIAAAVEANRAQDAVRASEQRYRLLFERNPEPTWVYDRETLRFLAVNEAAVAHYGFTREEFSRMSIMDIRPPEDVPHMRQLLETMPAHYRGGLFRHVRKDGSVIKVDLVSHEIEFDGRAARLVIVSDVTERIQAQLELAATRQQLAASDKLSALGMLVSGVAHEIRTPLTYLRNNLMLTQRRLAKAAATGASADLDLEELSSFASSALEGAERINRLVGELHRFVRMRPLDRSRVDLTATVVDALELFRATRSDRVDLVEDLQPTGTLWIDKVQAQQIVLNLVGNAADAVNGAGVVRVSTTMAPGGAMIAVEDDGPGIPPETQLRIFEPFFTTKRDGTGLGLAIVRRIVEAHGGTISCETEPGKGARFRVFLPREAPADGGALAGAPS